MSTDDIYPLVGEVIRNRRKSLSLTQDKLAAALHLSRASLANIEAGRQKILLHHLYAFADALGLDVRDFLVDMPIRQHIPLPSDLDERQREQVLSVFNEPDSTVDDQVERDETRRDN
jgi:transcriptional regulator with XRE-family HTH domain